MKKREMAGERNRFKRRWLLAGVGAAGAGAAMWRVSPAFWRHLASDIQRDVLPAPRKPDLRRWSDRGLHAAWLGHSTVLLKIDGFTIITDPILSKRAGIDLYVTTLGVKRLVEPALTIEDLPPVDLILLSHAHMDHFDLPTLRALEKKTTGVVTAHATSDLLRVDNFHSVQELRWNRAAQAGPARIEAFEVRHWGARVRSDTWRGYNGYAIECGRYRVLFGGDTADTDAFRSVRKPRGIDLAIMPIGAYNPWIRAHCTPEQAWRMGNDANADRFIPVHHQTFALGREPFTEPIDRFLDRAGASADDRVPVRGIGGEIRLT